MGCGASKNAASSVAHTTIPSINGASKSTSATLAASLTVVLTPVATLGVTQDASHPNDAVIAPDTPVIEVKVPEVVAKTEADARASALSKSVVPSIPASESGAQVAPTPTNKPVSFEIPLDEDMFKPIATINENSVVIAGDGVVATPAESAGSASAKLSLPKLAISERDIRAKLANTEERWKDLERAQQESRRKRKSKPSLTSQTTAAATGRPMTAGEVADPAELKQRLLEKETRATARRARELSKLQSKLAKQEEHAKLVQERKKKLGKHSNEDLNLSWGGEEDDPKSRVLLAEAVGIDGIMKMKMARKDDLLDSDSGKGSSAASVTNGSRSGSGRSLGFAEDGTEIISN
ncbi:hypothetical protein BC830DRAFT_1167805 [Chytriomyces sp. MP71]|nr:hypothetical protein BC830DRAFT_1167805 [Chytriomyces sp. MP71]